MRFARFALAAFAAAFCLTVAAPAYATADAEVKQFSTYTDTVATFDSGVITSGAALSLPASGALDLRAYDTLSCEMRTSNEAGGASHVFTPKCTNSAGTVVNHSNAAITVETNKTERFVWDPRASSVTAETGTTPIPHDLCPFVLITAPGANGITQLTCTAKSRKR
jgi:hypothetical protein